MRILAAADKDAVAYWSEYFKDSGYGEQLTKDLPKRVASALGRDFRPISAVIREDDTLFLEGFQRGANGAVSLAQVELSMKDASAAPKIESFPLRAAKKG